MSDNFSSALDDDERTRDRAPLSRLLPRRESSSETVEQIPDQRSVVALAGEHGFARTDE